MEIKDFVRDYPQASVTVNAAELESFGLALIQRARQDYEAEIKRKVIADTENVLMSAKEVAAFFSVSTKTVTRWRQAGYINPVFVGGLYKYRRGDCLQLLEKKRGA